MDKQMTTEQMVRKCFCDRCNFLNTKDIPTEKCNYDDTHCKNPDYCIIFEIELISRAARRFVRMEQKQKFELGKF